MNMLFWIWYARYKERMEEDDTFYDTVENIDTLIPSPIYFFIGLIFGFSIIVMSWLLFRVFMLR